MGILDGRNGIYIRICIAVVTLAIAIFDVFSDWIAFGSFVRYDGEKLTIVYGVFCTISSLLFILEVRNFIMAVKLYRNNKEIDSESPKAKKLDRWYETVSFLLMILEDIPCTIILYVTFIRGNCDLFTKLFEESNIANLALLGAFLSAVWKLLLSLRYCCCNCCNYHDIDGVCKKYCCCCARTIRPVFALVLMGYAAYLYFTFNNNGQKYRGDCFMNVTLTTVTP